MPASRSTSRLAGVAIMGATGTGKSDLAIELAERFGGHIISMDSRQIYRGFDIGTAKVSSEDRARVVHHLVDVLDPTERYSAGLHCERAKTLAGSINARGDVAWLVGGTGFYFRALYEGLIDVPARPDALARVRPELEARDTEDLYDELVEVDAVRAGEVSPNDRVRILRALEIYRTTGVPPSAHSARQPEPAPWDGPRFVLTMPREALRDHIAGRTRQLYAAGWVEEVRGLLADGVPPDAPAMNSLGYRVIAEAIRAGKDPAATVDAVITQTRQYAKRQETFFRGIPEAQWVDVTAPGWRNGVVTAVRQWRGL